MEQRTTFCAFILAGGRNSRMGTNKALLRTAADSPNLIERVIDRVRSAGARNIYILANEPDPYEYLDLPVVRDEAGVQGPLAGIISGLRASPCDHNLTLACDMPNIEVGFISYMTSVIGDYDALVPRWADERGNLHLEPLHAVYRRSALPKMESCASRGEFALHSCLKHLHVRYIEGAQLLPFKPARFMFRNLNSQAEWKDFVCDGP